MLIKKAVCLLHTGFVMILDDGLLQELGFSN
jgi:hypothetical protein